MNIKSAISDFRKGLAFLFSKPAEGKGDRKLAKICQIIEGQISMYGKDAVRTQIIKSIESDLKKAAKKGGKAAVEAKIANALGTPEYVHMIRRLGLDEPHIRVMAMEVLKNAK